MGFAVAKLLAKKGWRISIVDLNPERGETAAKELGGIFTRTDVTKYEVQAAAFQRTRETYGQIDFGEYFSLMVALIPWLMLHSVCKCWNRRGEAILC